MRFRVSFRSPLFPLALIFGGAISLLLFAVPPNMDEYLVYEPLACFTHPFARASIGTACDFWKLRLFGMDWPIRAYPYIGLSSTLFHAPLFFLFPHWLSARFLSLISLLLVVTGFQRLTRASHLTVLSIVGLSFPLAYQIISDTGPVGFACVLFAWVPLLIREIDQIPDGKGLRVRQAALGLLVFLGIEQKPFFLAFLPVVAAVGVGLCVSEAKYSRKPRRLGLRLIPSFLTAAIPAALLFSARTETGQSYFNFLLGFSKSAPPTVAPGFFAHLYQLLAPNYENMVRFAVRSYPVESRGIYSDLAPATLAFWLLALGLLALSKFWKSPAVRIFLGGTIATIVVLGCVRQTARVHHAIFALPYFLAALCTAAERVRGKTERNFLLGGLLASQLVLFAVLPLQAPREDASWARLEVLDYLISSGLDRSTLITHYDWGAYYISALYGSEHQRVGFFRDVPSDADLETLSLISRQTGLDPVFVGREGRAHDWRRVERYFPNLRIIFSASDAAGTWKLWRSAPDHPVN